MCRQLRAGAAGGLCRRDWLLHTGWLCGSCAGLSGAQWHRACQASACTAGADVPLERHARHYGLGSVWGNVNIHACGISRNQRLAKHL